MFLIICRLKAQVAAPPTHQQQQKKPQAVKKGQYEFVEFVEPLQGAKYEPVVNIYLIKK
jgi:hypothetical protein